MDWPVLALLGFLAVGALVVFIRDLSLTASSLRAFGQVKATRTAFRLSLIGTFCALSAYIVFALRNFDHEIPLLVVNRDYVSCVSWRERDGTFMRVPWDSFTNIDRVYFGKHQEPALRFDLDGSRAKDFQWTNYVLEQGGVLCSIRGLTDNPRNIAFPTDTGEIRSRVLNTWHAVRDASRH